MAQSSISKSIESGQWHDAAELRWAARHWASKMGLILIGVQVRSLRRKWGSISLAGRMTLNSELLDLPKELGEYVICHELVHLLAPNHGRVFKAFLKSYLPDWEERHRALRSFEVEGKEINL